MFRPLKDNMNELDLSQYLELLIEKLLKEIEKQNLDIKISEPQRKELSQHIAKTMLQSGEFSREKVIDQDPKFMHKLTIALVMTAKLGNSLKLFDDIKKLFSDKNINEKDLKSTDELQKKLSPQEMKQLKFLEQKILDMFKDLEKLNLIKLPKTPKLEPGAKSRFEQDDININLLGIINSHQTGSIQAVVQCFLGNLYGVPDQNPYNGNAQIDEVNKIDNTFGDPQGLENMAKENFESIGSTLIEEAQFTFTHQPPKNIPSKL